MIEIPNFGETSAFYTQSGLGTTKSLKLKPVNNRSTRPTVAMDDRAFMLLCVGKGPMLRYKVGLMYWRENKSAREIATSLNMTLGAVEKIIQRLARALRAIDGLK